MGKNLKIIPVNRPKISPKALKYLKDCVKTSWVSSRGPYVQKFEKAFAQYLGIKYATTTNSGTTALHLALASLDINKGDEVILPASTIGSCFFAIWYTGAKAIPIDVNPETYNIDTSLIASQINSKTQLIMPVHLFGHPCDMGPIINLAKKHKLKIVEDAAEAHGAEYKEKKVGTFGDIGVFSFYANKIITTGEGGMLVTNNKNIYEKAKRLKELNFSPSKRFIHQGIGFNYLMSNLQAAVGLAELEEVEKAIKFKRKIAEFYHQRLKNIKGIVLPKEKSWAKNVYWMYAILVKKKEFGMNRDKLMNKLKNNFGIQSRTFFFSPNIAFAKMGKFPNQKFLVAERIAREGLYLPSGLGNTFKEFEKVCQALTYLSKKVKK